MARRSRGDVEPNGSRSVRAAASRSTLGRRYETASRERHSTVPSEGAVENPSHVQRLKLVGNIQVPAGVARGEKRPGLHRAARLRLDAPRRQRQAALRADGEARLRHHALRHAGLRRQRRPARPADLPRPGAGDLGRAGDAGAASECRRRAHRRARLELRRRGRGLLRRRRQARGRRRLRLRLGPWRAQIPEAASDARRATRSSPPCWRKARRIARAPASR